MELISETTSISESRQISSYPVEGANLFFTQQARLFLEKKGVVLFKDSSTNKVSSLISMQSNKS
jgi:hypothetical protein